LAIYIKPTPLPVQEWFVICLLQLAMINLPIKFEVFISANYEDMKDDIKCGKWVIWGS